MVVLLNISFLVFEVCCNKNMLDNYENGKVGYARTVFDMMLEKNVICSTSMISGYMNQGSVDDAEDIFKLPCLL